MNDKEILEYMISEPTDLMFREPDNYKKYIKFLVKKRKIDSDVESAIRTFMKHHLTFYCVDDVKPYPKCMYGERLNPGKRTVFYEDLTTPKYCVELI